MMLGIFHVLFSMLLFVYLWRRQWHPTPVLLPGKSHGWRSLVGCRLWGRTELDTTEWLHFHFSLSFIGEGNGNPLQCSCLENPRDGGARWAAVYGVSQSWTRLKWLSSSSRTFISFPIYVDICRSYPLVLTIELSFTVWVGQCIDYFPTKRQLFCFLFHLFDLFCLFPPIFRKRVF